MAQDSQSASKGDVDSEKFDWHWVKVALRDVNVQMLSLIFFLIITPIYSFSLFLPTIIKSLGYSRVVSQLFTVSSAARTPRNALILPGSTKYMRLLHRPLRLLDLGPHKAAWHLHDHRMPGGDCRVHNAHLH